jgi:hypothetical protein
MKRGVAILFLMPRGLATGTHICRVSAAGAIRHVKILYVR